MSAKTKTLSEMSREIWSPRNIVRRGLNLFLAASAIAIPLTIVDIKTTERSIYLGENGERIEGKMDQNGYKLALEERK